jgi:hypothetical protein
VINSGLERPLLERILQTYHRSATRVKHFILNREFGTVRTVAVFGTGRGGTSVIAGCLRALGVCMGTLPHAYKHEWTPIVRQADGSVDMAQTRQLIRKMNDNHELWGWKFPSDVFHIETVTALLRNPGFIVVTRDPTEVALSSLARQDVPLEISLNETAMVLRYIAARMRYWPWPILAIPFAQALREPNALVEILCAFLQIDPDEAKRKQAIDFVQPLTRGYRPFDAKPDELRDFSPPLDDLSDSHNLAVDLSARYSKEYSDQFRDLIQLATAAAEKLAAKIRGPDELAIATETTKEIHRLLHAVTSETENRSLEKTGLSSPEKWRIAINQSMERLSTMAREAAKEALHSPGNYEALTRLYRALQLLIRIRVALDAAKWRVKPGEM